MCRMISAVVIDGKEIKVEAQACVSDDGKRFIRIISEEDEAVEIDTLEQMTPIYDLIRALHDKLIEACREGRKGESE
jgi:hypothetical protein